MHCPSEFLEDCLGVESCADFKSNVDMSGKKSSSSSASRKPHHQKDKNQPTEKMEKQFPPPLPWLATAENVPGQMPRVMERYYTDDGRLVIREHKVQSHEYFQLDRSNDRVTLRLVPVSEDEDDGQDTGKDKGKGKGKGKGKQIAYEDSEVDSDGIDDYDCGMADQTGVVEEEARGHAVGPFMGNSTAVV